jgi:hypothetical protein
MKQHFGGICHFHLQGRKAMQARNRHENKQQAQLEGDMILLNVT